MIIRCINKGTKINMCLNRVTFCEMSVYSFN